MRLVLFTILLVSIATSCRKEEPIKNIHLAKSELVMSLPLEIAECSGMIWKNNKLLLINDGGNGGIIHEIDIFSKSYVSSLGLPINNIDWEAITFDDSRIIIADIGNNHGNRTNLKLYSLSYPNFHILDSTEISYPEQIDFQIPIHNYDCEAIVVRDKTTFLFTKNRASSDTHIYTLNPEDFDLKLIGSISTQAMVTDACIHLDSGNILLLCNKYADLKHYTYIKIISISENLTVSVLGEIEIPYFEQFESITNINGNTFMIGSERELIPGGNLYRIEIENL